MQGEYTTHVTFDVRVLTLQQLADIWSMAMSFLPEVSHTTASFKRRGRPTDHEYVFHDADELARTRLDFRPGELKLGTIHISNADTRIFIHEAWTHLVRDALLGLPTKLKLEISGSNEAEVLKVRSAIEHWGEQHVKTRSLAIRLKLGVLAAGIIGTWAGATILESTANATVLATVLWIIAFGLFCLVHGAIPARFSWTTQLRLISGLPPKGGGPGGNTRTFPDPSPVPGATTDQARNPSVENS